ncbi:TlpA family protein disulfide reductase [Candidatus Fermentibacteria bacterium]|nr:TlpA family protein disulfide reductase [Candidatus Fermentibacteria bacterium]
MSRTSERLLWIPLVALLLVPVARHLAIHHRTRDGGGWTLFEGLGALDSALAAASGRPVLLNFWATWCGPCVAELHLIEAAADSAGDGAVVLAVSIGDRSPEDVRRFLEAGGTGLTVIWLDADDASAAVERFDLPDAVPVTIVLNPDGVETARAVGAREAGWFTGRLEAASGGGAGPDTTASSSGAGAHVNIVGSRSDSLASALEAEAVRLAGREAVDFFDPSLPEDSAAAAALFLPFDDLPYAQPCYGGACGRPVRDPAELEGAIARLAAP